MYLPAHFKEERGAVLQSLMREHPLATLVTLNEQGLTAGHLPLEYDPEPAPWGTLRGHLARANPQWRDFRREVDALAVFHGPQGYISPALYPSKQQGGMVVPTWNYAVVHASGPLRTIDDSTWLRQLVTRLTEHQEAQRTNPWHVADAPEAYLEKMLAAIVGIEISVRRLDGKWKMSQNRPAPDRAGVISGLRETHDPALAQVAEIVAEADQRLKSQRSSGD